MLITGLPDDADEEELTMHLDCLTDLDSDTEKYFDVEIKTLLPKGIAAKVTFTKEINLDDLLTKIKSAPYAKGIYVEAEQVPMCTSVVVENLPQSCTEYFLECYFGNKTQSGIDGVVSVELKGSGTAVIDVGTEERVDILMGRKHTKLGPEVVLRPYDLLESRFSLPLTDSNDLLSSTIPNEPFETVISCHMAKYLASRLDVLNIALQEHFAFASLTEKSVVVSPIPGSENVDMWHDTCSVKLNSCLQKFTEKVVEVDDLLLPEVKDLVSNASKDFAVLADLQDNKLHVIGDPNEVIMLVKKVDDFQIMEKIDSELVSLKVHEFNYIQEFFIDELKDECPDVEFTSIYESCSLEVTGKISHREEFKRNLKSRKCVCLELFSEPEYIQFLSTKSGLKLVSDLLKESGTVTTFQDVDLGKYYVVGFPKKHVEFIRKEIQARVRKYQIPYPLQFERVCQEPSWKKVQEDTETLCNVCVILSKETQSLCIVGDSSNFSSAKEQIMSYIREECYGKCRIPLEPGQWKLLSEGAMQRRWNDITTNMHKMSITFSILSAEDQSPVLLLEGDAKSIESYEKQIKALLSSISKSSMEFARPGGVQFFTSDATKATFLGFEKMDNSYIDVKINQRDKHKFAKKSMLEMCKGCTAENKTIILVKGDIAECPVDVIVNAANGELDHRGGVAAAIARKGGKIIQEESTQYYLRHGKLNDGEAVPMYKVGNLPCQCLIHAVGPKWENGLKREPEILKSACATCLTLARDFQSIAFPAISSGIYEFPMQMCANCLIESFVSWSREHPNATLNQIYVVICSTNAVHAFSEAIKQHLIVSDKVDISSPPSKESKKPSRRKVISRLTPRAKKANDSATSDHSKTTVPGRSLVPDFIQDLQYASKFITLLSGELLNHSAEVYVNTASNTLNLSDGAVAQSMKKAGGKALQAECDCIVAKSGNIQCGQIAVTGGGSISCKCIIHTVGEAYNSGNPQYSAKQLENLVLLCLAEADKCKASSIAFPALGAGNLRFPSHIVSSTMVGTIAKYLRSHQGSTCIETVKLVVYMKSVYKEFEKVLTGSVQPSLDLDGKEDATYKSATYKPLPGAANIANHSLKPGNLLVQIVRGDITEDDSDVIVCATNYSMRLGGKVAHALSTKAGPNLQQYLDDKYEQGIELEEGKVISLPGMGSLNCKFVYFVMTPESKKLDMLSKTVTACLKKAESDMTSSISIPAIGTGNLSHFHFEDAIQTISEAVMKYGFSLKSSSHLKQVRLYAFDEKLYKLFLEKCDKVYKAQQSGWFSFESWISKRQASSPESNRHRISESSYYGDVSYPKAVYESSSISLVSSKEYNTEKMVTEEVTVSIFAESDQTVEKTKDRIKQFVDSYFISEIFFHENVAKISTDDVMSLENVSVAHQVELKYQPAMSRIVLKGAKDAVIDMKQKIFEVCQKIAHVEESEKVAKILSSNVSWKSYENNGYCDYDHVINSQIEEAFQAYKSGGSATFAYNVGDEVNHIDFVAMEETLDDKTVYSIKRFVSASNEVEVPTSWDPMPQDSGGKKKGCHLADLHATSPEYLTVANAFTSTMPQPKSSGSIVWNEIVKIQRIQNPTLYGQYTARKKAMNNSANERKLFHGCSHNVVASICNQGFNRSFAGEHAVVYGAGAYFAVNAEYSARNTYSPPDDKGNRFIFYASVLTGEYTAGSKGLKAPPPKDPSNKDVLYDSVVDRMNNPDMFVIFQDAQCYPEYLITFT